MGQPSRGYYGDLRRRGRRVCVPLSSLSLSHEVVFRDISDPLYRLLLACAIEMRPMCSVAVQNLAMSMPRVYPRSCNCTA